MINRIWSFLTNSKNQRVLRLLIGGVTLLISGVWGAIKIYYPPPSPSSQESSTVAIKPIQTQYTSGTTPSVRTGPQGIAAIGQGSSTVIINQTINNGAKASR